MRSGLVRAGGGTFGEGKGTSGQCWGVAGVGGRGRKRARLGKNDYRRPYRSNAQRPRADSYFLMPTHRQLLSATYP